MSPRHILVDTEGLLLSVVVHAADIQDWDGAVLVLAQARKLFPWLQLIWADGGYPSGKLRAALAPTRASSTISATTSTPP